MMRLRRKVKYRAVAKTLFGVVCRIMTEEMYELILKPGIQALVEHHPNDKIVIVDSDSKWKYFDEVKKIKSDIIIEDIKNKDYEAGAWLHILEKYPNEDRYVFLQDSVRVVRNLSKVYPEADGITIFGPEWKQYWQTRRAPRNLRRLLEKMFKKMDRSHIWGGTYKYAVGSNFILGKKAAKVVLEAVQPWKKVLPTEWNCDWNTSDDASFEYPPKDRSPRSTGKFFSHAWERIWGQVFKEACVLQPLKISYLRQFRPRRRGGNSYWLKKEYPNRQ